MEYLAQFTALNQWQSSSCGSGLEAETYVSSFQWVLGLPHALFPSKTWLKKLQRETFQWDAWSTSTNSLQCRGRISIPQMTELLTLSPRLNLAPQCRSFQLLVSGKLFFCCHLNVVGLRTPIDPEGYIICQGLCKQSMQGENKNNSKPLIYCIRKPHWEKANPLVWSQACEGDCSYGSSLPSLKEWHDATYTTCEEDCRGRMPWKPASMSESSWIISFSKGTSQLSFTALTAPHTWL